MAETFNRASAAITTTAVDVYSCPSTASSDRAVVLSVMIANVDGTDNADVTAFIKDSGGNAIAGAKLANTIQVQADSSLELIANKLILKNGETLALQANVDNRLEATVSVLEITA